MKSHHNNEYCIVNEIIYFNIDSNDIKKLDQFEGEYYQRIEVCVYGVGRGKSSEFLQQCSFVAEAYTLKPEYVCLLSDDE